MYRGAETGERRRGSEGVESEGVESERRGGVGEWRVRGEEEEEMKGVQHCEGRESLYFM